MSIEQIFLFAAHVCPLIDIFSKKTIFTHGGEWPISHTRPLMCFSAVMLNVEKKVEISATKKCNQNYA